MQRKKAQITLIIALFTSLLIMSAGCYKDLVPKEKDYFSGDMSYSTTDFTVYLGQTNVFINLFNANYSTQPLDFTITNPRRADTVAGDNNSVKIDSVPAPNLLNMIDATEWKEYYSGEEKTIDEITAKQYTDQRPILDIRPNSGEIFFWRTDSTKVKPGIYFFDVVVKNKGGQKTFPMVLDVRLPHPYDPYDYDDITGLKLPDGRGGVLHPSQMNGVVDLLDRPLPADSVDITFHKTGAKSNTITIQFEDQNSMPIPLTRFNMIQWDSLTYNSVMTGLNVPFGFNRRMNADSTAVTWDITNPFPVLADRSSNTEKAFIDFPYNRVSFGQRKNADIGFTFDIHEPGEWLMVFKFNTNPNFEND